MNITGLYKQIFTSLLLLLTVFCANAETTVTYYIQDGLGSPIAAMDEAGSVVWHKEYHPYGVEYKQDPNATATEEKVGFTGHVQDNSTGLTYMGARYYDPRIGRFMGIDPVGFNEANPMTFNRYAYANNNPYMFVDPDGEEPFLASRPTVGRARHMFVVHDADAEGNGGIVRSLGRQDGGWLGEVDLTTGGFSEGTHQKDIDFWKRKGPDLSYVPIPATDNDVKSAADNLISKRRYTYPSIYGLPIPTSGKPTINSNAGAQAVADHAAKQKVKAPDGWHPGAENSESIEFK